nr:IncF plasmid conjugative transfer pilus assembly protein TraW [Escherichia coli]
MAAETPRGHSGNACRREAPDIWNQQDIAWRMRRSHEMGLIALLIWGSVAAADLVPRGDLWPVKEPDMLTVIRRSAWTALSSPLAGK